MFHFTPTLPPFSRKRQALRSLVTLLLVSFGILHNALAQSYLQANGPKIVNASNQEVILRGVNLGGWQIQEGYMLKPGYGDTQSATKKYLYG